MGMLMFGSLAYYLENGEPDTGFQSIPQGMWCVVHSAATPCTALLNAQLCTLESDRSGTTESQDLALCVRYSL